MDGKRTFEIQINGVNESIEAVASLNRQLDDLSQKISKLESKTISVKGNVDVSTSTSSDNGGAVRSLSEEVALQKELNKLKNEGTSLEAKQIAYQDESYQKVLAQKDVLKEIVEDQKAIAAQERLQADTYSNTMQGMKQKLADLKSAINTTDLGDSDSIKKMTQEANELTNKLKEMEEAYGQFGRNVGNYQSAAEGFKGLAINVGGVTQEFDNAKQALKTLQGELRNLQVKKDQGMILSEDEVKRFQELPTVVAQLKSSIADAGKPMDNLMDTMQSFVAMAQVSKGFSAFFGIDDSEIQKSIQQLLGLQQAMQGLQNIQKQIQTGEFLGGWLQKASIAVDNLAASLTSANKAQATLNTTNTAGATASQGLAAAETAQAAATNTATVATKGLSLALKSIGIGLIISAVAALITYWDDIKKLFTDTVPALKGLGEWFNKLKAVVVGVGTALINYLVQPFATLVKVIKAVIDGNFKEIPKIITDGIKNTYNVIGNFQKGYNKETERQQKAHNDKMREQQKKANEEAEKDAQAKYGEDLKRTKEYYKKQMSLVKAGSDEYKDLQRKLWETERREKEKNDKKNLANSKKYAKEDSDAEKELVQLRINNMKEGLRKTITQLEEERKARLAKLNVNLRNYKELEKEINALYDKKIEDARKEHAKNVEKIERDMYSNLLAQRVDYYNRYLDIIKTNQEQTRIAEERAKDKAFQQNISSYGIQGKNQYSPSTQESLGIVSTSNDKMVEDYKKLIDIMREYSTAENALKNAKITVNNELEVARKKLFKVEEETNEKLKKLEWDRAFMWDEEYEAKKYNIEKEYDLAKNYYDHLEAQYSSEFQLTQNAFNAKKKLYDEYNAELQEKYSSQEQQAEANRIFNTLLEESYNNSLSTLFNQRLQAVESFWKMRISNTKLSVEGEAEVAIEALKRQKEQELKTLEDSHRKDVETQQKYLSEKEELLIADYNEKLISEEEFEAQKEEVRAKYHVISQDSLKLYNAQREEIEKQYAQKEIDIENSKNEKIQKVNSEYYQDSLQEFRDFQTALNNLESKQPVKNAWGFTNWKQTDKNNKELLKGYEYLADRIRDKRMQLSDDFEDGFIDESVYKSSLRELDSFADGLGEKMDKVKQEMSLENKIQTIAQEAQQYISALANSFNQIMSAMWDAQDRAFDHQQDEIDKWNEELEDALDKQKEIVQSHKDAINSIEDELSTARGDRRSELIERLNAEVAAQKKAAKEEERIKKEQEKAQAKEDALQKKREEAEYNRQILQAIVNGAMAVTMAAVNKWPVPAIPMMALAASTTAAQLAIMKQNRYAKGGLLEGPSHSQGGVKVYGGYAELEGHEYIVNKKTTIENEPLLEYINSKHRRLDLNDMLDFYTSKNSNVRKVIASASPKSRFADGGLLTFDSNNVETFNNRLLDSFERYSNRPVVVAVTEIEDKMADVHQVRALAGLPND